MDFGTKLVFRYLFCQLEIQIVLHNHISAQLLLSKHRHSKKPTGAKSQELHHKDIYNQKTLIGY